MIIFLGNEYKIIVSTSGRFAAGTDARVFIILIGINESSEEIELKDNTSGKQLFEAGRCDDIHFIYFRLTNKRYCHQDKTFEPSTTYFSDVFRQMFSSKKSRSLDSKAWFLLSRFTIKRVTLCDLV